MFRVSNYHVWSKRVINQQQLTLTVQTLFIHINYYVYTGIVIRIDRIYHNFTK